MPGWVLAWNGKPENFRPERDGIRGREFPWTMAQHFRGDKTPQPGEPFLLWKADYKARRQVVVVRGEVISTKPFEKNGQWRMTVVTQDNDEAVVSRDDLRSDPVLTNEGSFVECGLFNSQGSNHYKGPYRLTDEEWVCLMRYLPSPRV
ncbi:hypothetical protein OH809_25330 [Streptomyces sp. NBC_00873]|uniref:hypothetical protein n=1 Tax=Streptomyces sp. NBC_00873 TaxID=2975852 RepID=UPI003864652C|nr:hypothetical protein OH809_25330 [Streptomyces sp. NBC_00873]